MANFWLGSVTPPSAWTAEMAYSGIRNYKNSHMGITTSAMTQLRAHLNFIQMRFHCRKEQGRTFHVITGANSTGEAVVQYFSGQFDTLPASCGSFITMEDDNSELAKKCSKWGNDGSQYVGKWGQHRGKGEFRMYDHTAFIAHVHHWVIFHRVGKCDVQFYSHTSLYGHPLNTDTSFDYGQFSLSLGKEGRHILSKFNPP